MNDQEVKLTLKQQLFVEAYLGAAKGNATEAARLAGYRQPQSQGPRLLQNVEISSRVRAKLDAVGMSSDEVLNELAAIGRADWREFVEVAYNRNGDVVDAKIILKDKVRALELLGKYHKLFVEQVDVTTKGQAIPILNIYASETGKPSSGD